MKKILGLDLGTNSIGWALIQQNFKEKTGKIDALGVRIIPMDQSVLGKFGAGQSYSQTQERTKYRGIRRLIQRNTLRRERLHRVLHIIGFLPKHYADSIDFEKHVGQFKKGKQIKLNYRLSEETGKHQFIFMDSFNEMVKEFKLQQPELFYKKINGKETKIPMDWTLYYLRKKALTKKITKQELAWILLNFNQKRGYYQLRDKEGEENNTNKNKEIYSLKVTKVEKVNDKDWYNIILENGLVYRRKSKESLEEWKGKTKEFIVTTELEGDGKLKVDKQGNVNRTLSLVNPENDWFPIKKKIEQDIEKSTKTVGEYIYKTLLEKPNQKIKGGLIKTIERKFYKDELRSILKTQIAFHPELKDAKLYTTCIKELYPKNEVHQNNIKNKNFEYLFLDDIIFYQRPLKSKKSTISNCLYETKTFYVDGQKQIQPLKCISKSHPLFQEFRLWQFLSNLKMYQKNGIKDVDVTTQFLNSEKDWVALFDFLNDKKEIDQKKLINYFIKLKKISKKEKENYRWNYSEDTTYPANQTRASFLARLKKVKEGVAKNFLTKKIECELWHIIYSVKNAIEFEKALGTFATKKKIDKSSFVEQFKNFPPFKNHYGAYSEKTIKKLVPLMRMGKYWNESEICEKSKNRISLIIERIKSIEETDSKQGNDKKIALVADDEIPKQVIKSFLSFKDKNPLQGLNTYQACYAVYGRFSEVGEITLWKTPQDITNYLKNEFKQHSLRNPIVEKVITETLRVVRDIWQYYGNGTEHFFDEIHVELGREMKSDKKTRVAINKKNIENKKTNQRIKAILEELKKEFKQSNIRPYSPSHQEILKIYEEGVFQNSDVKSLKEQEINKIIEKDNLSESEIKKYKLWLEQGYISPYTGKIIPLSKLFSSEYEIEHIIPKARYYDDSLFNKIICEKDVNHDKTNKTAYEYIKEKGGGIVKNFSILKFDDYVRHCNQYFKKNRKKLKNLLTEDIPERFTNRQLNDSRYISKIVKNLLSNVVRAEGEKEVTSKNLIPVIGEVTSKLKQDWGLNDKWNELIEPRFKRLNELTNSNDFGYQDQQNIYGIPTGKKFFRIRVPKAIEKDFNKKRIDHRHHALDALVVACCTRVHIQYLNTLNTQKENYNVKDILLIKSKQGHYTKHFEKPWEDFPVSVKNKLETIIISFKQNLRVINKTNNKTWQWVEKGGQWKKELIQQTKGENWAIRKPLHKETISGKVIIKQIKGGVHHDITNYLENWDLIVNTQVRKKVKNLYVHFSKDLKKIKQYLKENPITINGEKHTKIQVYEWTEKATAKRIPLTEISIRKKLEKITDSGIQMILENHLKNYIDKNNKERFDLAFSIDGIEALNKNIIQLNKGKKHHPIYKVRVYEQGNKFKLKETKFVEAAKGTNLFFAVYWDKQKQKRNYETIPLYEVIEHQKKEVYSSKGQRTPIQPKKEKGQLLFILSPNDLVYVPTDKEMETPSLVDFNNLNKEQIKRVYKTVSFTKLECFFLSFSVSKVIKNKVEFSSGNKMEKSIDGITIKERCWKLKVDRLGNIINVIK